MGHYEGHIKPTDFEADYIYTKDGVKLTARPRVKIKHQRSIMLSGSWFSPEEEDMLKEVKDSLLDNPSVGDTYWCLDQQYDGIDVTEHPEVAKDKLWQEETFLTDIDAIKNAEVLVAMTVPEHGDTGQAMEQGYAYALGKPVVLVLPNDMWDKDNDSRINLMLAKSATAVIPLSALASYDFNRIRRNVYPHAVY